MNARWMLGTIALVGFSFAAVVDDDNPLSPSEGFQPASDAKEARGRAKMLHEMVRGTLQIMCRDFFDEENSHTIPSASLEDVFHEMHEGYEVKMKWVVRSPTKPTRSTNLAAAISAPRPRTGSPETRQHERPCARLPETRRRAERSTPIRPLNRAVEPPRRSRRPVRKSRTRTPKPTARANKPA